MIPPPNLRRLRLFTAAALLAGRGVLAEPGTATILSSPHNLSVSGPGEIRAESEADVCGFCHTTHRGGMAGPMWNRFDSPGTYIPYTSSTSKASPGQPTGSSKLCLSCHDGTVAIGMLRHRPGAGGDGRAARPAPVSMARGVSHLPAGPSMLGKDLSDDHPVSFPYDASLAHRNGELRHPSTLQKEVRLDGNGEMQCTSCHHPHYDKYGKFLVMDNTRGALCLQCHDPEYWASSAHATDMSSWSGKGRDPWPGSDETTVRDNACANCHRNHGAGTPERLLTFAGEEQGCLVCHNGNVAESNLEREVRKPSAHNVFAFAGLHDPAENVADSPAHVECTDCHNPHAAQAGTVGGGLSGTLANVPGVSSEGSAVPAIQQESELCYRCHGDAPHTGRPIIPRQFQELSVRRQFLAANRSFHPVESAGRNDHVPSLKNNMTEASTITCTDCHNNDQGPAAGGTGPAGPHGSIHHPLLERRLELRDGRKESAQSYAMCYKCHDRESLMSSESFPGHARHVVDARIACTTCHDPHGVAEAPHLINFNLDEVQPLDGRMEYDSSGESPTCTLRCHDVDHAGLGYDASGLVLPALLPLPEATP